MTRSGVCAFNCWVDADELPGLHRLICEKPRKTRLQRDDHYVYLHSAAPNRFRWLRHAVSAIRDRCPNVLAERILVKPGQTGHERPAVKVLVTVPVFNEERRLAPSIRTLHNFLSQSCPFEFEVVIADNGSTDQTGEVANAIGADYPKVRVVRLEGRGRGRALKKVWGESQADILSYMDVDLSTDLKCFPPLIECLLSGHFDIAVGSRLLEASRTTRGFKREFISRGYNLLVKGLFRTQFSDAQCGFKGITKKAAIQLLPLVEDNNWFMDTELLILAEALGYRIFDMPVRWVDNSDSRVRICQTAWEDLRGLLRVRRVVRQGRLAPRCCGCAETWHVANGRTPKRNVEI